MQADVLLPRIIRVGGGVFGELPDVLRKMRLARPFIVSDHFMAKQGYVGRLEALLREAGIAAGVFLDTVPDPTTDSIDAGVRAFKAGDFDSIVALGGGSPIDSAKAIGVLAEHGGTMREYKAPTKTDVPGVPLIAIPTTAGTGSEVTRFAVITDTETNEKMLCGGMAFMPDAALVDYELTLSKPPRLTADTGVDALTHAIEAYVSRKANTFSDGMARIAMKTIADNIRIVYAEPQNLAAREAMMLAAMQAGIAFSNASVALVHGMSRPIGAFFHLAHGLSNAMLLPKISAFSTPGSVARYADCSRTIGVVGTGDTDEVAARKLVEWLADLNRELAVPTPKMLGIDQRAYFTAIPTMAQQALDSGSPANNPRVPTLDEIAGLYEDVWS